MRTELGAAPSRPTDIATKAYVDGLVSGSGVTGPGASTSNNLAAWNGTGGAVLKDSGVASDGAGKIYASEYRLLGIGDANWYVKYEPSGSHIKISGSGAPGGRYAGFWNQDTSSWSLQTEIQGGNTTIAGTVTASNLSGTNTGDQDLSGLVPKTTTVNGHALSANVTVSKSDVGLGNVDNTSDATKNAATAALTNKDLTSGTNTFPTLNQNTTGSAASLTTARNIDGQAFNGTADITVIAPGTHAATSKTTPVDADEVPLVDSAASNVLKKLTWANLKAAIKSYYDSATSTLTNKDLTSGTNTFPTFNQNTTGSAASLTTGRTVQTNLASTSTATFNGTANITPGVTGTLPVGNGGTGAATLTGLVVGNGTSPMTAVTAPSGAVVGTTDTQTITNKDLSSGTNTFPTLNQSTTGNAATATKLATARNINGVAFDGTAAITNRLDQLSAPTASVSMGSQALTNLADPTNPQDAATKNYTDAAVQGLQVKPTATVVATSALPAGTYNNGTSGVGATFTVTATGTTTVDGHVLAAGELVLATAQASAFQNGLYTVTTAGTTGVSTVLTRHVDMNSATKFSGAFVPVGNTGTTNPNSLWLANPSTPVTVGTTNIPFNELNRATDLSQGTGITISGNQVSIDNTVVATLSGTQALTNKDLTGSGNTFPTFNQNTTGTAAGITGKTTPTGAYVGTTDTQTLTNKDLTSGTNTFPTFNQNTTGSAATLTTSRNIDGQAFNGSADITVIAPGAHAATSKATPVDADELPLVDSAASNTLKKLTWANLKATVKSYYDSVSSTLTNKDLTSGTNTFPTFNQNTTGSAAKLTTARTISGVSFDGTANITLARQNILETVTTSSASSLTLTTSSSCYVFTGTTTTWTLPALSGNAGFPLTIENRGSGAITLQRAGADQIYLTSAVNSVTIAAGASMTLLADSTYWNALSLDLANNGVGILPIANGGTGNANGSAVKLTTARTIGGTSFDGTANITQPYDLSLMGFGAATVRVASSYGDNPMGIKLQRACTLTSVTFRANTADASGNLVVELRKNGTQISGTSTTIAAANQVAGGTSTGSWSGAAGDIITAYITGVGTTPGNGLVADITGTCG